MMHRLTTRFLTLRRLGAVMAVAALLAGTATAQPRVDDGQPLIRGMGEAVFAILGRPSTAKPHREAELRAVYRERFDRAAIAAFVVGRPWREASEAQRAAIADLLDAYAARFFASHLAGYAGAEFHVFFSEPDGDGVAISSQIVNAATRRHINLKWRLAKSGTGYIVRDVLIENVSLALTLKREIADRHRRNGDTVEGLIDGLKQLVEALDRQA
jgi:phospholipid transport system substrate-binding protein